MADLRGAPATPPQPKIFSISCSFGDIFWQNRMLAPSLEGWRHLLREILDPPLFGIIIYIARNRKVLLVTFSLSSSCLNFFCNFSKYKAAESEISSSVVFHYQIGRGARGTHPLSVQFFVHFHAGFSEKLAKNNRFLLPPLGLSPPPPPPGNPGSATVLKFTSL